MIERLRQGEELAEGIPPQVSLFHELLNKRGRAFQLTAGQLIAPSALDGDPVAATAPLKAYVEAVLPADPERPFA